MTARRALGLLLVAVAAAAVLHAAGSALPVPPVADPARLGEWWADKGAAVAVLTLARLGGLAFCCYLALVSLLGTVAAVTRWRWTVTLTMRAATPALRRAFAGGGLALALASGSTTAAAAAPAPYTVTDMGAVERLQPESALSASDGQNAAAVTRASYTVTDLGASPVPADHRVVVDVGRTPTVPAPYSAADLGPALSGPSTAQSDQSPRPAGRVADQIRAATGHATAAGVQPDSWLVEPGDHLWGIAAATVAERSGSEELVAVASYWLKLIEANADTVGDNPDLIHPGQVIRLPD